MPLSVGIDLVNVSRIARWLGPGQSRRLSRVLTAAEKSHLGRRPAGIKLARLMAAKEAFFKASGRAWMGPEGFSRIEITPGKRKTFSARWVEGSFPRGQGCFFEFKGHAGAQVILKK